MLSGSLSPSPCLFNESVLLCTGRSLRHPNGADLSRRDNKLRTVSGDVRRLFRSRNRPYYECLLDLGFINRSLLSTQEEYQQKGVRIPWSCHWECRKRCSIYIGKADFFAGAAPPVSRWPRSPRGRTERRGPLGRPCAPAHPPPRDAVDLVIGGQSHCQCITSFTRYLHYGGLCIPWYIPGIYQWEWYGSDMEVVWEWYGGGSGMGVNTSPITL